MSKIATFTANPTVQKGFGIGAAVLLLCANLAKMFVSDKGANGKFGVPTGSFVIWTIGTILLLVCIILGELHKVPKVLGAFPLLMARSGRGGMMFFISFITCCRNGIVLGLTIPAMLISIGMFLIGYGDTAVTIEMAYADVPQASTEKTVEMKTGTNTNQQQQPARNVDIEDFGNPII